MVAEEYDAFGINMPDVFEQRQTPSLFGVGQINQIADATILANEDVLDANGDGTFGVARRPTINGVTELGRYGWKAQIPSILDFVNDAMFRELWITTPGAGRGFAISEDLDGVADPELSQAEVDDLAHFILMLPRPSAPARPTRASPKASSCSRKSAAPRATRRASRVLRRRAALLQPARTTSWRQGSAGCPSWAPTSASTARRRCGASATPPSTCMTARAEDLEAAILAHDGEATTVRSNFEALSAPAKAALILFLEDL